MRVIYYEEALDELLKILITFKTGASVQRSVTAPGLTAGRAEYNA